jgi:hypothetical protein
VINLQGLGIMNGGERDLNTHALSELEKANRNLDILTGFTLIDDEKRMYVFEGLSNGGMRKIEELIPLDKPNNETLTILKNKSITF